MTRKSSKRLQEAESSARGNVLRMRKFRLADPQAEKVRHPARTFDEIAIRLEKMTMSRNRLLAERRSLKKIAAQLQRELAECKLAEEWTRRHEANFRAMIESVREHAIILLDPAGRILSYNNGAERITGYSTEEILGKHFSCFYPLEDVECGLPEEILRTALAAGQWEGEGWRLRHDGARFWASVVITAVRDGAGRLLGFTNVTRDLTQRKQAEETVRLAKEEAEAANQAKSDFLANISHEVRTPMTGIIGMAGLLAETDLSVKQREYCEIIRRSSESLLTVINEILDFSKAEAGKVELEVIDFDLRTAVEDVTGLFASQAADKELELINFLRYDVPTALRGDPGRLRQVLSNLVSNALKFTTKGEVVVRVGVVEQNATVATLRFEVADTGIGIPRNSIDSLFQPFTQADASTTRKYGGTGLGLAICKQFVSLMGGEIGVESDAGKGSRFWFTVPLLKQRSTDRQTAKPRQNLAGLRALVVESNATTCAVLEHYLDALGMKTQCAGNGAEALALLRREAAGGMPFDMVILDLKLLAPAGMELARDMRKDATIGSPKLLLLTSVGKRGDAKLAEQAGFDAYLTKPVSFSCLTDSLAMTLGESPSSSETGFIVTRHTVAEAKAQNRLRVLVVDDNHINQKVAASLLENMGHRADLVGSGKEALEAFILVPYDVVLMDLHMPELDGFEACRRIRALAKETDRRTFVIAVTAHAMKGDREKYLVAGFDGHVSKPINPKELRAVISSRTNGSSALAQTANSTELPGGAEILNLTDALARVGGNRDLLAKIARVFLELYPKLLEECHEAVARADCEMLARAARTMASSAGQLGAERVRDNAKKVEQLARRADLCAAPASLDRLESEIRSLESAISGRFDANFSWLRADL